jgi:hypothetical protein
MAKTGRFYIGESGEITHESQVQQAAIAKPAPESLAPSVVKVVKEVIEPVATAKVTPIKPVEESK